MGDDPVDVLLQAFGADEVATRFLKAFVLDSCRVEFFCELALGVENGVLVQDVEETFFQPAW